MSRYFFHIIDEKMVIDEIGVELPDLDRVRTETIRSAGQMLSMSQRCWNGKTWRMIVADEAGTIVFGVNFSVDRHGL